MGITQTQKFDEDHDVSLPNNPFVPPKGDTCFINDLPPELLSRIFEAGSTDDDSEEEDDVANDSESDNPRQYDLAGTVAGGKGTSDSNVETKKESEHTGDEEETDDDSDATGSSYFPPSPLPPFQILVSHVCRHWRNVSFSTPSLWTKIEVGPDDRPPYKHVSTMLERSKDLPIDIYVDCEPAEYECVSEEEDEPEIEPLSDANLTFLYSLLVVHIHRWRTIEVSVLNYEHMYVFLTAASDPSISAAPQLKTLELYHHEEEVDFHRFGDHSWLKNAVLFGGSAPCLTRVVLWGVHVDWNQSWVASAPKLVDLELAYHPEGIRPSWAQFSSILRGAPALERLSLRQSGPSGDPPHWFIQPTPGSPSDLNAPVQLLKVTDFIIAFQSPSRAIGLLHKFYLSTLKNLVLDFEDDDYTEFVDVLAGPATSLSRPSTKEQPRSLLNSLEKLKIAGLSCRTECAEKLYGELGNLTQLNISLPYLPYQFIDILSAPRTVAERVDVWLPRLLTLYVSGASGNTLRELVKWRKEAGAPLDALYVEESSCYVENEDMAWLKENVKIFEFFEGSDDEDVSEGEDEDDVDFEDYTVEDDDEWSEEEE